MNDLRIERDINTGKLTVAKCEASFICKADLVHKFVNQVNTLIDQNAILERELNEAREQRDRLVEVIEKYLMEDYSSRILIIALDAVKGGQHE